jgi:predicted  nucleic acid-binding Zn-ribbon protein
LKDSDEVAGRRILDIEAAKRNISDCEIQELELAEKESAANAAVSAKYASLDKDLRSKRAERITLAQKLPPALLRKYDLIRTKRTRGAALLQDGRCFACNMSVPPQMEQRLLHVDILEQCPSCSRFLLVDIHPAT